MGNLISERVADFLQKYPPFNELTPKDLNTLSLEVEIFYKESGEYIFKEGDQLHDFFYVVHKGSVNLRLGETNALIDICDEGDIFGLRPLIAGDTYRLEAQLREEGILYGIPIQVFRPFASTYEEIGNFLIESFASNTRNPYSKSHSGVLFPAQSKATSSTSRFAEMAPVVSNKRIVSCSPETSVLEVANLMTKKNVGSVLVLEAGLAIGIITDKDLRTQIISGNNPNTVWARNVMNAPVHTYPERLTLIQAQLAMMKNNISYLCLTPDGTPHTPVSGILSKYDLVLAMGNNPEILMRAIKRTRKIKTLKPIRTRIQQLLESYLEHNFPMSIILKLISELNDACVKKVIELALKKQGNAPVDFAWLSMGSHGRSEQLLHTDQDSALIFEDCCENKTEEIQTYFLDLAERITKGLRTIGYEYCPAEMMASNPDWCMPLKAWKKNLKRWISTAGAEEVLLSSIFFDFNISFGKMELVNSLSEYIFEQTVKYPAFYNRLASGALQNPSPTGFFRQFLVEQDGRHKDFFDVKKRALMPFTDAARVLILTHGVKSINSTAARFEKLAELEPQNQELFLSCSYATKALLKFRTKQGLLHNDSGRYIALDTLTKAEKIKLKRTFKTLKEVQELLAFRFKLNYNAL
ncbi:MAG: hypothetical protein RLZZ241_1784 [Bacteroidota bacterium]|jgi:CBS domain-containing protein